MRLSRANIPLASEDRTHSQAIYPYPPYNLAPHFWPGFINLQHFCHSRWRNPVRLSKSGLTWTWRLRMLLNERQDYEKAGYLIQITRPAAFATPRTAALGFQ